MITLNSTRVFAIIVEGYMGRLFSGKGLKYIDPHYNIYSIREIGEVNGISFTITTDPEDPISTQLNITIDGHAQKKPDYSDTQ